MCPEEKPYSYRNNTYCCEFKEEKNMPTQENCDGRVLTQASTCCKDNKFIRCPEAMAGAGVRCEDYSNNPSK